VFFESIDELETAGMAYTQNPVATTGVAYRLILTRVGKPRMKKLLIIDYCFTDY
jgi:hypothetical protein